MMRGIRWANLFAWTRANLFNGIPNALITLAIVYVVLRGVWALFRWGLVDAVWSAPDGRACRVLSGDSGACWAFIGHWYQFILFGRYPYAEHWRALLAMLLLVALLLVSCDRRLWRRGRLLASLWLGGLALYFILMHGGIAGLPVVTTDLWNGLPLTLLLAVLGLAGAFPLAILLALGRRSGMPVIRALSIGYIELVRGVPLITVLFMASVMLPLFLPAGADINNMLRALAGLIFFYAAYLAEVIRGGLEALPRGQYEAAASLGLTYRQSMGRVILPQALTIAIPPLVNTFIAAFKDTTLVTIVGLLDLLTTATTAIADPQWRGFYREAYGFVGVIYFVFCFALSRYSRGLERRLAR